MLYTDNQMKFAVVLNKSCQQNTIMNALSHACLGLGNEVNAEFLKYDHPEIATDSNISRSPAIILSAKNSKQLLRLVKDANENGLMYNYFTEQMIAISADEQIKNNRDTDLDNLEFVCIVIFGKREDVDPLTKRFSLFKSF